MSEKVALIAPSKLQKNPENPRLIFREEELLALQESIATQGILVPLTVFADGTKYSLLDGERRWRCALKLGLSKVPAIIQPKPDKMTNLMMMFAIHNARRDWDPLPTAMKLQVLEDEFTKRYNKSPSETELAGIASLPRGEVRRLKKLLRLPATYREQLLDELEKPRSKQILTVDHVIEASSGAEALRKREILTPKEEVRLRDAIIAKYQSGVINNTVAPRKLVKLSQAVARGEIERAAAKSIAIRLISDDKYSIDTAYEESIERSDIDHATFQLIARLCDRLNAMRKSNDGPSQKLAKALGELRTQIDRILK